MVPLRSAVILAGGNSSRLGSDKGLVKLAGKPLVRHVSDRVKEIVDEVIIVIKSEGQLKKYIETVKEAIIIADKFEFLSPVCGALSGFEKAKGKVSILLPCDTPLISTKFASLLLDVCENRNAVIPRYPNGYIEPLQAAYNTKNCLDVLLKTVEEGKMDFRSMIERLPRILYISTLAVKELDPKLLTFFNINTVYDLNKAESILKSMKEPKFKQK
jgi:molybdopterin-guanine dinucleotide biosynthesis protein A